MAVSGPGGSTAIHCLVAVARYHGVELDGERLILEYPALRDEPDGPMLARIARDCGFKAQPARLDWNTLTAPGAAFPVIARLANGNSVILLGPKAAPAGLEMGVLDPLADRAEPIVLTRERLESAWTGECLLIKRRRAPGAEEGAFGFGWFLDELDRNRASFIQVAAAALAIGIISLATPLFFQLVIDRVLEHQVASTLQVLGVGVVIALVFDGVLEFLRGLVLLHATSRIDVRLSTQSFRHLLALPIGFFERATSGTLVKHLQQSTVIRQFLTGSVFMTMLEGVGLIVFLPLLFLYSAKLALVVLFFALVVALVVALLLPPYRRRLLALYRAEGERQAQLVETLHGMGAIKSLALEPFRREGWDNAVGAAVSEQFRVGRIALGVRSGLGLLEKLAVVAVVWIGAEEVIAGTLTVGALVAFQMISGRVSSPLVRFASLLHEFQEAALSVRMLGAIMNSPTETLGATAVRLRPALRGEIEFERLGFTYPGTSAAALRDLSLHIPAGTSAGIVGESGSGKTTLTRLVQGLYRGYEGQIRMDGLDLREIDLMHLRRSLGVVPQETFLFRGTVRDNIAAARPHASFEETVRAARAAGADEFIRRLPNGYDTLLEEGSTNLSGGQRQRMAIARALLLDPPVLVLDEATSALDPESEAVVRRNLAGIATGRTLLIVSHRLSMVVNCDVIFVMQGGTLLAQGNHRDLLRTCTLYRDLWNLQTPA